MEASIRKQRSDAWRDEDIDLLVEMRLSGYSWATVAGRLGRSIGSCHQCARNYGLLTIYGPLDEVYNKRGDR